MRGRGGALCGGGETVRGKQTSAGPPSLLGLPEETTRAGQRGRLVPGRVLGALAAGDRLHPTIEQTIWLSRVSGLLPLGQRRRRAELPQFPVAFGAGGGENDER